MFDNTRNFVWLITLITELWKMLMADCRLTLSIIEPRDISLMGSLIDANVSKDVPKQLLS